MKHSDYLKKKRTRETRKKIISVISAIVVFVTTYALVLPAITLDVSKASQEPGMVFEQMQFKTTASAASVTAADSTVEAQVEETQVEEPADEAPTEEEAVQEEPAESSEETLAASDEQEEAPAEPEQAEAPAEPAKEEAPVAENEEVQDDKSKESSSETAAAAETDASKAQTADTQKAADQAAVDQSGSETTDAAAAATTTETAAEFQIPTLDALDFDDILTGRTAFYYYHPETAEEAESISSDSIDDWKKAGSDTVLAPEDFVRVYLSYEIPAGALNETNTVARYRLPADLELSDKQIKAINKYENGIAASKSGSEHDKYLGAEAIEGSRTPDEKAGDEYISATVKVEKTGNGRQELVFTFIPYTVEKNQISYDEKGSVKSKGKEVKGFFTFDLTTSQIDFENTEKETVEKEDGTREEIQYSKADVVFADKDGDKIERELTIAAPAESEEQKVQNQKTLTSKGSDYTVTVSYTEAAQIPDKAELAVREIEKGTDEYESYLEQAKGAVDVDKSVNEARFFDITILVDGEKIEPQAPVNVQITFTGIEKTNTDDTQLLHYKDDKKVEVMDQAEFSKSEEQAVDTVQFETEGFSVYGIVGTETLATQVITAEGETYTIEVTCGSEAKIPAGAELRAREIEQGSEEFFKYYNETIQQLGVAPITTVDELTEEAGFVTVSELIPDVPQARYFDISIISNGEIIEPQAPVEIKIVYDGAIKIENNNEIKSVHFAGADDIDINSTSTEIGNNKTEITFYQDGFSVTGTVEASSEEAERPSGEERNTAAFVPLRAASDENQGPQTTKTVRDNGNGTHTIRLDILGEIETQTEITKANVIVILDTSGSMSNSAGYSSRWAQATAAVNNVASTLLGKNNPDRISGNEDDDIIEMALVTFNTSASTNVTSTTSATTISNALNRISPNGGTNWEDALQEAAGITFNNDGDPTYVIFISDGNPTYRNTPGNYGYLPMYDNDAWHRGNQATNAYYTYRGDKRSDRTQYGLGSDDPSNVNYSATSMQRCYDHAADDAAAVVNSGRQFYGIGVYGNAAWVENLVSDSGAPNSHYYNADDSAALATALSEIADAITSNLGFSNVSTSDGVTALSHISAKVVDGHATGFKYYKNGSVWADAPEATPTEDGITWDLSSENPLEDQTTYSIEFDIWPSQEAYDTVANLNNGLIEYANLPQTTRDQINDNGDGTYSLKTNTSLTTTYTKNGVTDTDEWDKGNAAMALDVRQFKVRKLWNNQLDGRPHQEVELIVTKDGQNYLDGDHIIRLTDNDTDEDGNMVSDDIFISCGFITHETNGYDVKEHGHDYSIKEPEKYSYYWDLTAAIYRPMVIDGTPHMLVKTNNPTGTDGQDYYVIDGNTYQVKDTETVLEASNDRRSWVNLTKTVTDNSIDVADPDAAFEYTITVNNANAASGTAGDTGSDYYVWFSVDSDPSSGFAPVAADDLEYSSAVIPEDGTNGYFYVASGTEFTISIKKDWTIRFMNLPVGSDYTFNESGMPNGFDISSVTPTVSAGSGATPATVDGSVADGDVDKSNTEYTVAYTNDWKTAPYVYIQKTDDKYANSLSGAAFHLNKRTTSWANVADYTLDQSTDITVGGEAKTYDNLAPLGPIGVNQYQLIETECPDGYIKAVDGFEFEVEKQNGVLNVKISNGTTANLVKGSKTIDGKTYDVYIIQIPNTPGKALPNTGGSGTLSYTLGGLMLIVVSALMYGFRMRRRERRLN